MKRTLFIVTYDVSCHKRRTQIRKMLQAYSISAQKSVFECWLTSIEKKRLIRDIQLYLDESDLFHIFKTEHNQAIYFGVVKSTVIHTLIIH